MKSLSTFLLILCFSFHAFSQIKAKKVKIKPVKNDWEITVKKSKLKLSFPILNWELNKVNSKGGKDNPRYFYFEDFYQNMVVSGYFQPDTAYKGQEIYWQKMQTFLKSFHVPDPYEIEFKKMDDWDCIFFDVPLEGGVISNLYANMVKDGTWLEARISMTTSQSNTVARNAAIKQLNQIKVTSIRK